MHCIFIDANVLIGFFDASQESLVVLDKLITLVQAEEVVLLMPKQALREYWKNRDKKINDLLREFEKQRSFEAVPLLVREDPDFKEIHKLHTKLQSLQGSLAKKVREQVEAEATNAVNLRLRRKRPSSTVHAGSSVIVA